MNRTDYIHPEFLYKLWYVLLRLPVPTLHIHLWHLYQLHFYYICYHQNIFEVLQLYLFSYYFTLRGVSTPSEAKNNEIFTLTNENSYGISNGDGTYDLYLYGEYIETVDSLMGYDYVPIYNSLEDVPQN